MGLGLRSCVMVNCATHSLKVPLRAQFRCVFNIMPMWSEEAGKPTTDWSHSELQLFRCGGVHVNASSQTEQINMTKQIFTLHLLEYEWNVNMIYFFILHWKDTFIDGKHVGYHSKQWSIFWRNPPDYSTGVGTGRRTQKSIKFVLIFYSCVVSCVSQIWFTSFLKKEKRVLLKGLSRYNRIHSVWSIRATPVLLVKSKHSQSENGININHHS